MQIKLGSNPMDKSRVDFHGNTTEGVFIELVDQNGMTFLSKQISETERLQLIDTLTRKDNGKAV